MSDNEKSTCTAFYELLPSYHRGRLTGDDLTVMQAHLTECAECQQALVHWQQLTQALQSAAPAVPPAPSSAEVWRGVQQRLHGDGVTVALADMPQHNGHYPTAPNSPLSMRVLPITPATPNRSTNVAHPARRERFRFLTAAVLIALLAVALFGALAARHQVTSIPAHPSSTPTPVPPTSTPLTVVLPAPFAIPQNQNLLAATSLNGTDFWIGGDGFLAHYDKHTGWQHSAIPAGAYVSGISMISPTEGWAVGTMADGTALMLYEVQSIWHVMPAMFAGEGPYSVQMLSSTDGWAWGHGQILRYQNGIWTPQSVPFDKKQIAALAMITATDGWVASQHSMWHYHDGTWTEDANLGAGQPDDLNMLSATDGWAKGSSSNPKARPLTNDIWHYDGVSWRPITIPATLVSTNSYAIDQLFMQSQSGWATLVVNQGSTTLDNHLLRYDHGTWSLVTLPLNAVPNLWVRSIVTVGANEAWAIANTLGNPEHVVLLHYLNGAWQV